MTKAFGPVILSALLLSACQALRAPAPATAPPLATTSEKAGWRNEARPADVERIESVKAVWQRALDNARKNGFRRQVAAEGRLLDPDAALPFPAPSPGTYMCRAVKFGPPAKGAPAFAAYKPFFCFVGAEEDQLFLIKQTGTERPSGYVLDGDGGKSLIFLGSLARADGPAVPYGSDPSRDLAGLVERIGPLRFRLVLPRNVATGQLDVIELVPSPDQSDD
jgi:hypothetical protein